MEDKILALSDDDAVRILNAIAGNALSVDGTEYAAGIENDRAGLVDALSKASPAEESPGKVTDGDLARHALVLAAENPDLQPGLSALVSGPAPESYGIVTGIVVAGLVLALLQTRVKIEHTPNGWKVGIDKKAASNKTLLAVIERLHTWFIG